MAAKHFDSRKQALDHLRRHGFRPVPGRHVFEKCDEEDDEHIEAAWTPDAQSRQAGAGILFIDYVGPCDHGTGTQRNPIETERHALGVSRAVIMKSLRRIPIGSRIIIVRGLRRADQLIFLKTDRGWEDIEAEKSWTEPSEVYITEADLTQTVQDAYDRNESVKVVTPFGRIKSNPLPEEQYDDVIYDFVVDYYSEGPAGPEGDPGNTSALKVDGTDADRIEISEWTADLEYAGFEPDDVMRVEAVVSLDELFGRENRKHRVYEGGGRWYEMDVDDLVELAAKNGWEDEAVQGPIVDASIAYMGYWGGTEDIVSELGE